MIHGGRLWNDLKRCYEQYTLHQKRNAPGVRANPRHYCGPCRACAALPTDNDPCPMIRKTDYWLAQMEPEDRAFVEPHLIVKGDRGGWYGICDMLSNGTRQWQTLPGGWWTWRELHNKYAAPNIKMRGIYEDDPWPSYNFTRITDELRTPTQGAARFSA